MVLKERGNKTWNSSVLGRRLLPAAMLIGIAAVLAIAAGRITTPLQQLRAAEFKSPAPNLLVIVADDLSACYLGAAGDSWKATPHLDALAAQGVFFDRAYCNSPLCTPSRQSFITGLLPHAVGVTRLETKLPENTLTLGGWLGARGYRTAAFGKMHFNGPAHHGFETRVDVAQWLENLHRDPPAGGDQRKEWRPFVDPPQVWLNTRCEDHGLPVAAMESTYFVDRAISYMNEQSDRPFAVVVGFYEPHAPFVFPREWKGRYDPRQFQVPPLSPQDRMDQPSVFGELSEDDFRGVQAAYYTSLSYMDFQIGRLLAALDRSGLGQDTLVVFLGDNGYLLGQHGRLEKNCFYEPSVRVPLIFRWPGHLPKSQRKPELVELVDLLPTVCHLLGVPVPPGRQGIDLTPLLESRPGSWGHDAVFSEYPEAEEAMLRSFRYKLIVGSGRRRRKDHLDTGQPPSGPYMRLFDLEQDPGESTNLASEPRLESVRSDLLQKLHDRLVTTWTRPGPIPESLSRMETIFWCLRPRD
jgi:choline-sulfatase